MKNLIQFGLISTFSFLLSSLAIAGNPHVSFSKPNHGQHFPSGTNLYVKVNASDSDGIDYVKLYVNGHYVDREDHHPYEWGKPHKQSHHRLNNMQHGTYHLRAVAYDRHGNKGEKTITIYIDRNSHNNAPSVSFSKPYHGQHFPQGTDLYVKVNASDHDDYINYVNLYINGHFVDREDNHPYEWGKPHKHNHHRLNNMQPGTYHLKARAYDNYGRYTDKSITIYIDRNNSAPVVSFESPRHAYHYAEGYDAHVKVSATDHDDYVKYVDLYINNSYVGRDSHAPYQWSSDAELRNLSAGTYTLKAIAYDNYGKKTEKKITFHINRSNQAPVVSFVSPSFDQNFVAGTDLSVKVNATDHDDYVDYVELYIDDTYVGRDNHAPYEWRNYGVLNNLSEGTYTLFVKAYDNFGKKTEKASRIHVTAPSCNANAWFVEPIYDAVFSTEEQIPVVLHLVKPADILKVDLYLNSRWIAFDEHAPFFSGQEVAALRHLSEGRYQLKAEITDKCGGTYDKIVDFDVRKSEDGNDCGHLQIDDFESYTGGTAVVNYNSWVNFSGTNSGLVINNDWGNMLQIDNSNGESSALWTIDQNLTVNSSFVIAWDVFVPKDKYAICAVYSTPTNGTVAPIAGVVYQGTETYNGSAWQHFEYAIDVDNGTSTLSVNGTISSTTQFLSTGTPGFMTFQSFNDPNIPLESEFYIDNLTILPFGCTNYQDLGGDGIEGRSMTSVEIMEDLPNQSFGAAASKVANIELNVYPNPVVDRATIAFELAQTGTAIIDIIDLNGRSIHRIEESFFEGKNEVEFVDTYNLPTGTYFVRLQTENTTKTLAIQIIK
ncbi:MAG: Ig-like domain-containing protein [Bacteroidota bacterium]